MIRHFTVTVEPHTVMWREGREWEVTGHEMRASGVDAEDACRRIVVYAHVLAEVPPLRRLVRRSMEHASAVEVEAPRHKIPA